MAKRKTQNRADPFELLAKWLSADTRRVAKIARTAGCGWQVVLADQTGRPVALRYSIRLTDRRREGTLGETVADAVRAAPVCGVV